MSVFSTKANGVKVTINAANVMFVQNSEDGKAIITFVDSSIMHTEVGYDSVRKNVAKALSKEESAEAE